MNVRYTYAIVGFSPDLTDPKAKSVPIAVVGSGEAGAGGGFVFMLAQSAPAASDPVTSEYLTAFPNHLQAEVTLGLRTVGPDKLIGWLAQRMAPRSLHLLRTGEDQLETSTEERESVLTAVARRIERFIEPNVFTPAGRLPRSQPGSLPAFTFGPVPELTHTN